MDTTSFIGKKFNRLTVIEYIGKINGHHTFKCRCDCGTIKNVNKYNLVSGIIKSCKCLRIETFAKRAKEQLIDISGQKFGRLLVLKTYTKQLKNYKAAVAFCDCICDCGTKITIRKGNLVNGHTKSCKCFRVETSSKRHYIHGKSKSSEHKIWSAMKRRCNNTKDQFYKYYGGRGIMVCSAWLNSFVQFYKDMGPRPSKKHSIERRNNNKGYSKSNCYWATYKEQSNNRRNNAKFKYKGKWVTVFQLSQISNKSQKLIYHRLHKLKWSVTRAIKSPKMKNGYI